MNFSKPYNDSSLVTAEIEIRGRFMMMAADIEWTLLNIMVYAGIYQAKQIRKFQKMMMHQKIACTISDLKKYKPDFYNEYKEELEKLWEFKDLRNDLAHHRIRFEEGDTPTYFEVFYVAEEQGLQRILQKEYSIEYIFDAIMRFKKLNISLSMLHKKLHDQFYMNNPPLEKLIVDKGDE